MTLYQFMADHPIVTVILGYFAMCAIVGSAAGSAQIIALCLKGKKD